jgi:hypothetical protein
MVRRALLLVLALCGASARVQVPTLRLRGGMSGLTDQMAEIRAARARKYQQEKSAELAGSGQVSQKAEEESFEGAEKVWCYAQDKIGPSTVGTKKKEMAQGDARNFYFEGGVTVLRNRRTGAVLELLHDSQGWFHFCSMEGGALRQMSANGDVLDINRWYAPGFIDDIKQSPLKVNSVKPTGLRAGLWKLQVDGRRMVLTNDYCKGKAVHLTEDGFFYVNEGLNEAMRFQLTTEPERMSLPDAQELIIGS